MIAVIIAILILVSKRRRKNLSTTGDSRAADTGRSLNIVFFEDSRLWARQCMYSVCMTDRRTGWTTTEFMEILLEVKIPHQRGVSRRL